MTMRAPKVWVVTIAHRHSRPQKSHQRVSDFWIGMGYPMEGDGQAPMVERSTRWLPTSRYLVWSPTAGNCFCQMKTPKPPSGERVNSSVLVVVTVSMTRVAAVSDHRCARVGSLSCQPRDLFI
ncbi:hypothetical protein EVAR_33463_1 [Eumeta japonica]|uniref:Uncharacterized protein n=1 Tax=Eumeta variegata TaxID=151549 RepID=A0A4C1WH76_EUMVA|nr:hypothetical protein EVAR_33463_1 [Eumeta japonica]